MNDRTARVVTGVGAGLLALAVVAIMSDARPAWGNRPVEYLVVERGPQDLSKRPPEDFQDFLNRYGREGWRLVPVTGPINSLVFVR